MSRSVPLLLINACAAIVLAVAVGDAVRLLGGTGTATVSPAPSRDGAGTRDAGPAPYDQIIAAHLYGRVSEQAPDEVVDAAPTTLDLRLLGVVNSTDRGQAQALIAVEEAPGRYFRVNQLINGTDARIVRIASDQVTIERGGRLERVLLWSPENMARANEGASPPPLPGVAVPAFPDLGPSADAPAAAVLIPELPGAARDTP